MVTDLVWPARTRRLSIRPLELDDFEAVQRYRLVESVDRWMTTSATDREAFRQRFEEAARLVKVLAIQLDGEVIGDLTLLIQDSGAMTDVRELARGAEAELGWCLNPQHQGHGYATEAVAELIRICFEDLELRRVTAMCFAENEASWRLMERVHMRREQHTVRDSLHRSKGWLDGFGYALLADEWQATATTKG
jgi:RimJ/RimL family protein N-acetyltransferase